MSEAAECRVFIADDHRIVRDGLKLVLEKEMGFTFCGEASDGMTAVEQVEELKPHVLVVDLMIPRLHGLEVVKHVKRHCPDTKVLVLTMHADEPYVREALHNGAHGYLLKDSDGVEFVKALRTVAAGKRFLDGELSEMVMAGYADKGSGKEELDVYDTLTSRERLVLQLAAEGLTSQKIATKLYISPRTAETHRANLLRKLSLKSQTDLVKFAIRKGIVSA